MIKNYLQVLGVCITLLDLYGGMAYTLGMEKVCRFGHICTSGCQKDTDCPCLTEHCCEFSEEVCDRTCDDCYWKKKDFEEDRKSAEKELFDVVYQWGRVGIKTDENCNTFQDLINKIRMIG